VNELRKILMYTKLSVAWHDDTGKNICESNSVNDTARDILPYG
jgi:streptomycin 6-kinase